LAIIPLISYSKYRVFQIFSQRYNFFWQEISFLSGTELPACGYATFLVPLAISMYSASVLESAVDFWRQLFHETAPPFSIKT
jgi:hypothetical protein